MTGWEGQVLAIAFKELLEAVRTLGRGGFGHDRALLSSVIRDLLTENPNLTRAEATLKALEALGTQTSADFYIAQKILAAVQKRRLLEKPAGPSGLPPTGPGISAAPGAPIHSLPRQPLDLPVTRSKTR
ncbi:MAG: hypothetical protein ABR610_03765 [Thermoanaerobaculia bacterium]|nr:hypothetical protein [Acidobacteriota bacterium]